MSIECLQGVANDYERLFENDTSYDVIIFADENEKVKELRAHSIILRFRSQYFFDELTKENVEKREGKFILKIPNIPPNLFKIILRFIYCGRIDLTKLEGTEIIKLLNAANALNLLSLVPEIEDYLIKDHHEFLQTNPMGILETIYQQESFTKLRNFYFENICKDPEELFNSDTFFSIKAPLLEFLLKRDDLSMDEVDIWNSLITWGFAQNPSIPKDVKEWKNEETTIMERTLHRFIPLIRFHHMSSDDFLEKVLPFRELLPQDLVVNLLAYALAPDKKLNFNIQPPRQSKYDSILVNSRHFAIFSSWVDQKKNNVKKTLYDFKLLYRASRDGNTIAAFHQKCNNKGANIVVVKINGTEQIVGGYNPFGWEGCQWKSTKDSFIFSFVNRTNLQSAKVAYVKDDQYSVCSDPNYGPIFGSIYGDSYYIYCNTDNTWHADNPNSYAQIDIPKGQFQADDYEVFQVNKR